MGTNEHISGLTMGERFKDARIEYNIHGKQSMDAVHDETGVTKSLIQALESDKGRDVRYPNIQKLAVHYGVSIDWLLGLSPNPSLDPKLNEACKYTGLSEEAIQNIKRETASPATRLALEILLCHDSDMLHNLCVTIYKAVSGYLPETKMESLLECFPLELKQEVSDVLSSWGGIVLEPKEAMQYNSFEAGNILSSIVDSSEETAIRKNRSIFGQLEIRGEHYGND